PVLDLAEPRPDIVARLEVQEARVPDFAAYDRALPASSPLRLVGGSGSASLRFEFSSAAREMLGRFDLIGQSVEATYRGETLIRGDLKLGAQLDRGRLEDRKFQLSDLRLDLDGVSARCAGAPADAENAPIDAWWARIELPRGEAVLTEPIDLTAEVQAVLRDALPLVHLLRSGDRPKRWLHRLLEEKRVQAAAQLALDDDEMAIDGLTVRGGRRLTGRGVLSIEGKETRGLMLVEYGPLSVAAELLPGGERDYRWTGSARWYETRLAERGSP
ncbi:MAG: hypothetical protein AAF725_14430, partial [Acidobacteriota bacterium]